MRRNSGHISTAAGAIAALLCAAPAVAQDGAVSHAVVQPLPPHAVDDLSDALRRLARNAHDLQALLDAGNASLALNDIDAAVGFFGRAQELAPADARVKLGLAGAFVHSERPIDALQLFQEAEQSGALTPAAAGERGLAYDLVGDNAAAQAQYRLALARGQDDDIVRRLAISQAISGDRAAFEKTLYPQLAKEDFAAFRARAFGLAILGEEDEAVAIAEAVMPADLSARISPYLRYMGRLTKAQQAAAANLGMFPRAAQIGRDDPRIAQYSPSSATPRGSDARLAPSGEALGPGGGTAEAQRRRPDRGSSSVALAARDTRSDAKPRGGKPAQKPPEVRVLKAEPKPAGELPPVPSGSATGAAKPAPASPAGQVVAVSQPVVQKLETPPPAEPQPAPAQVAQAGPATTAPGFDLSRVAAAEQPPGQPPQAQPQTVQDVPQPSVADAFSGFALAPAPRAAPTAGAVDITAIKPPREVEEKPAPKPAKPAPPANPRRFWVQVATGKDVAAFKWDWRRISGKAPEILGDFKPMTTPWVEANRLLAGPFKTEKAANEAVSKLKAAGIDTFEFTSDEGQEIKPLG